MTALRLTIQGLRVSSELNAHAHWRTRQKRARGQHDLVRAAIIGINWVALLDAPRLKVTFTRVIGPRGRAFDDDNLVGAFKHCRDAVAKYLGHSDNDPWFVWVVNPVQERGAEYGVRLEFEAVL